MNTSLSALRTLSTEVLLEKYAANVQRYDRTEHWGRQKRIYRQQARVIEALESRADGSPRLLLTLREHPDPVVRLAATILCRSVDPDGAGEIMRALAQEDGPVGQRAKYNLASGEWREESPYVLDWPSSEDFRGRSSLDVPRGMTRAELEERVHAEFPEDLACQLLELALPSIGMWPRRLQEGADPRASRLGGMPLVPEPWAWPRLDDEPMLFVGQINCAELPASPSASVLPSRGLISFFAEHDYIHCCTAGRQIQCCAVFHWPDIDRLTMSSEPIEDFEQLRSCGLAFYDTWSLPGPRSLAIYVLGLDDDQGRRYAELHSAVRSHGVADETFDEFNVIRLLGWPDPIFDDVFDTGNPENARRLLLQLGSYDDGRGLQHWGPGGAVYFSIPKGDLPERRFDRVDMDVQIT
jgi:uncharacterized protein YwqG